MYRAHQTMPTFYQVIPVVKITEDYSDFTLQIMSY